MQSAEVCTRFDLESCLCGSNYVLSAHTHTHTLIGCWLISQRKVEGNVCLCRISWWPALFPVPNDLVRSNPTVCCMNEAIHRVVLRCGQPWWPIGSFFFFPANDFLAQWEISQGRDQSKQRPVNLSTVKTEWDTAWCQWLTDRSWFI